MMVVTLEMMERMLDNSSKVDNHWHLLMKMISHYTQDEDHDSRRVGLSVGAIGKPYRGRRQRMTPYN